MSTNVYGQPLAPILFKRYKKNKLTYKKNISSSFFIHKELSVVVVKMAVVGTVVVTGIGAVVDSVAVVVGNV